MDVSIVIPCYNSGIYLPDALDSISSAEIQLTYEVVIVDDGSADVSTHFFLQHLDKEQFKVIYQDNRGPAGARNTGIRNTTGKYLLFLDADNKIRPEYLTIGKSILDAAPETGVVYGDVAFFGVDEQPRFIPQPFDIARLLAGNYIDMCAMVRREALVQADGFDEDRTLMGHEDWDLWIRIAAKGWKFQFVDKVLFDYRNRAGSLIATTYDKAMFHATQRKIFSKFLGGGFYRLLNRLYTSLPYYALLFMISRKAFFRRLLQKLRPGRLTFSKNFKVRAIC